MEDKTNHHVLFTRLIYANQNNFEELRNVIKKHVLLMKCYEAFNELIMNNLMTPNEEWEFELK